MTAVALGSVLVLTACSSSDDPAIDETADELIPLSFQASWINDAEFMGYFIAIDEGLYEEAGLEVEYLSGGPNVIPESSVISGAADVALTSPDTTVSAIVDQGAPLKIIGAHYQQNPLGIVSLAESGISSPADLVGKTVAVPDVNRIAFDALLTLNDVDASTVTVVPYAYDPTPLLTGEVDATLDFVTNVPFTIEQEGATAVAFTLYEYGYRIPNNTIVVTEETLESQRDELIAWLSASREGWVENFVDPAAYPPTFENTWFAGTGRTMENEVFFNTAQQQLMEAEAGYLSMTEESIQDTIDTLALIGIEATPEMFDLSLLAELD